MSEPTTQTVEPEPTEPTEPTEQDNPNHEAAKYRTQLRAAEAQRDTLATSLAAQQTAMVDYLTANALVDPGDLWRHGGDLSQLVNEDGAVDPAKVAEAVALVTENRPHLRKRHLPAPNPAQGSSGSGTPSGDDTAITWSDAFRH